VRGTNTYLDAHARVLWAKEVAPDFHARYSATARTYHYLLMNEPVAPALLHGRVGWFHRPLDAAAMDAEARSLVGEHDFSSFRDAQCQAKSPVRDLREARVERKGNLIVFRFSANAFLHHMVRNLVGALVYVGCERQPRGWLTQLLATPPSASPPSARRRSRRSHREPHAHQDLRPARSRARPHRGRGGRGCDRPRLPQAQPALHRGA
jgi:tRNA pseudouridine38-40 synthase